MKALDLCCCGGGAARGYAQAGFQVLGVDIDPQPNYPFEFVRGEALEYLRHQNLKPFDIIHVSPPCQGYSTAVSSRASRYVRTLGKDEPRLIAPLRALLEESGKPYVIENVMGARKELRVGLTLCGSMFGLPIARHRIFETNWPIAQPMHARCSGVAKRFSEAMGWEYRDMSVTGKGRRKGTTERWKQIMGIEGNMTQHQLSEALPPAYTRYIGQQFLSFLANHQTA